jgi:hypothetical protein
VTLQDYLDDLESLRADLDSAPTSVRAILVRRVNLSIRDYLMYRASDALGRIHIYAAQTPETGERSTLCVDVDPTELKVGDVRVVATLHGIVAPGRAIVFDIDGRVHWPTGPARAELHGPKWPRD